MYQEHGDREPSMEWEEYEVSGELSLPNSNQNPQPTAKHSQPEVHRSSYKLAYFLIFEKEIFCLLY